MSDDARVVIGSTGSVLRNILAAAVAASGLLAACASDEPQFDEPPFDLEIQAEIRLVSPWRDVSATVPARDCADGCSYLTDGQCSLSLGDCIGVCRDTCMGGCDPTDCVAKVVMDDHQEIIVSAQNPDLDVASAQVGLTIESVTYDVSRNSLNVDLAGLSLHAATSPLTSPRDPDGYLVGTLGAIPAGGSVRNRRVVPHSDGWRDLYPATWVTRPFNLIVSNVHHPVTLEGGDPVLQGGLTISVTIRASVEE